MVFRDYSLPLLLIDNDAYFGIELDNLWDLTYAAIENNENIPDEEKVIIKNIFKNISNELDTSLISRLENLKTQITKYKLNTKESSSTTEDLLNIKTFNNIEKQEDSEEYNVRMNSFRRSAIEDENKNFTDPNRMVN